MLKQSISCASAWWRSAVIYQVYPRSFADANGDGIGDLPGVTSRLDALVELGVDAVWLSPFYPSPQRDAGYDVSDTCDVDPRFGTLADFDALLTAAHARALRVIVDIVPNHCSSEHPWFQAALAAAPGAAERARFLFRDGRGDDGAEPPNNWESIFGGPAWTRVTEPDGTPGQWYLHLFDTSQPDFDWTNPDVRAMFEDTLRFWLDRGVDGFRIDVAHGLVKAAGLPDWTPPTDGRPTHPPYFAQDGVHAIYRRWRQLVDAYPGDRLLVAEAWVEPLARAALWVRPDELHQGFNFAYLETPWQAEALHAVITESLAEFGGVGAPASWVLSNHDVVRHATRLSLTAPNPQGVGLGLSSPGLPRDPAAALRRARAATALMLALPGAAYLYQGEELGLPEDIALPDTARQDPTWFRTHGERFGRDGCRVPIPWQRDAPSYGFGPEEASWLPQPPEWAALARDVQRDAPHSTLSLYRAALRLRRAHRLGTGALRWHDAAAHTLAFAVQDVEVVTNLGSAAVPFPAELDPARMVLASSPLAADGAIPPDTTVWVAHRMQAASA